MIRTLHHKLALYHHHELGEFFDLRKDPHEHENLWEDPAHAELSFELMKTAFDAAALPTISVPSGWEVLDLLAHKSVYQITVATVMAD